MYTCTLNSVVLELQYYSEVSTSLILRNLARLFFLFFLQGYQTHLTGLFLSLTGLLILLILEVLLRHIRTILALHSPRQTAWEAM
jgi:hypothetical protein